MTTKTRTTPAQREKLLNLIRASEAAKTAAAELKAAEAELKNAERAAMPILSESRTIRDENGIPRTISVSLDKSFTRGGTTEERIEFAKEHGLQISPEDVTTSALKREAEAAMAAGLLVPIAKIVID